MTEPRTDQAPHVVSPRLLVAAPDKYRGTLTARAGAEAAARAAAQGGWSVHVVPLADGGEGTLDAAGGAVMTTPVTGPLGERVEAEWRLIDGAGDGPTAVIEMARASGLELVGGAAANDPVRATTRGTGELILAALAAGARHIVVGCGGSATTDGGLGALEVLERGQLDGVELLVATDVVTRFVDAARVFGPQKGAAPSVVEELTGRLERLAATYLSRFGVDVSALARAGAAGGLAGGLAAIGGRLVSGFDLVADLAGLDEELLGATLVVTGEGRLDQTSLDGKVVGGVIGRVAGHAPVLVIAGDVEEGFSIPDPQVTVVSLAARFGLSAALERPVALIGEVVRAHLGETPPQ